MNNGYMAGKLYILGFAVRSIEALDLLKEMVPDLGSWRYIDFDTKRGLRSGLVDGKTREVEDVRLPNGKLKRISELSDVLAQVTLGRRDKALEVYQSKVGEFVTAEDKTVMLAGVQFDTYSATQKQTAQDAFTWINDMRAVWPVIAEDLTATDIKNDPRWIDPPAGLYDLLNP